MEYKHPMFNTVVIDLDGVISDYKTCEVGCDYFKYPKYLEKLKRHLCPVKEGAKESLEQLKSMGIKIVIQTSRVEEEREVTEKWLKENKIPYDELKTDKPRGFVYIDDHGWLFGDWDNAMERILERRDYYIKEGLI